MSQVETNPAATVVGGDDGTPVSVGPSATPVRTPQFEVMREGEAGSGTPIDRFYGVNVTLWAELGRVTMSLGDLLQVAEGSVLKLDRTVSAPVDVLAQGVRVARGEVVVVDDHFAVRIKEIERTRDFKP